MNFAASCAWATPGISLSKPNTPPMPPATDHLAILIWFSGEIFVPFWMISWNFAAPVSMPAMPFAAARSSTRAALAPPALVRRERPRVFAPALRGTPIVAMLVGSRRPPASSEVACMGCSVWLRPVTSRVTNSVGAVVDATHSSSSFCRERSMTNRSNSSSLRSSSVTARMDRPCPAAACCWPASTSASERPAPD